jgi:hypothetical protein
MNIATKVTTQHTQELTPVFVFSVLCLVTFCIYVHRYEENVVNLYTHSHTICWQYFSVWCPYIVHFYVIYMNQDGINLIGFAVEPEYHIS